jgi:hypothetical protein
MNNHLSVLEQRFPQQADQPFRGFPQSRLSVFVATIFLAFQYSPLLASEFNVLNDVSRHNAASVPQDEIAWMSGGIGGEAREEMRKEAAVYSVHLVFSDRNGGYLAGIPFTVAHLNGREIYSGISEGPLLYLKLPPGAYQIAARFNGLWQSKRIQAGKAGGSAKVSFVDNGE